MTERRERIPADEVKDSKKWNLPFWTEPAHVVHSEEAEAEDDVLVEDEEIEVEPLTAEQLEAIRQEAYNEGLEQGLVEGRQKGEKLGYDEGFLEGKQAGEEEGKKLGFDAGFEQGEKQAFENGSKAQADIQKRYEAILSSIQSQFESQKQSLAETIPDIVLTLAQAVIQEELSQGSEHIVKLVEEALNALPLDSGDVKIEVNPDDLPFIEAAIEQGKFEGRVVENMSIEAGGCEVHTRYSSVNFGLSDRWKTIEKQYRQQIQLALNNEENTDDILEPEEENQAEPLTDSQSSEPIDSNGQDSMASPTQAENQQEPEDIESPTNIDPSALNPDTSNNEECDEPEEP